MNLKLLAIFLVALFAVAVNAEFGEDDVGVGKSRIKHFATPAHDAISNLKCLTNRNSFRNFQMQFGTRQIRETTRRRVRSAMQTPQ